MAAPLQSSVDGAAFSFPPAPGMAGPPPRHRSDGMHAFLIEWLFVVVTLPALGAVIVALALEAAVLRSSAGRQIAPYLPHWAEQLFLYVRQNAP